MTTAGSSRTAGTATSIASICTFATRMKSRDSPTSASAAAPWRRSMTGSSPARYMLTHFLINSNFFLVKDPKAQPIDYASPQPGSACASPFTNLDPPA